MYHKNIRENLIRLFTLFNPKSYNEAVLYYWIIYDNVKDIKDIAKATPAESITRNIRKLVETGLINPPENLIINRQEIEKEYKIEFSQL